MRKESREVFLWEFVIFIHMDTSLHAGISVAMLQFHCGVPVIIPNHITSAQSGLELGLVLVPRLSVCAVEFRFDFCAALRSSVSVHQ